MSTTQLRFDVDQADEFLSESLQYFVASVIDTAGRHVEFLGDILCGCTGNGRSPKCTPGVSFKFRLNQFESSAIH